MIHPPFPDSLNDGNTLPADDGHVGEAPGMNTRDAQWIERVGRFKPDNNPARLMARSGDGATARRKNGLFYDTAFTPSRDVSACQV
jgi:hypothetical protein